MLACEENKQLFIDYISNAFKLASLTQHSDHHFVEAEAHGRPYPTAEEPTAGVTANREDFDHKLVSDSEEEAETEGKEYEEIPAAPVAVGKAPYHSEDLRLAHEEVKRRHDAILLELEVAKE